jgi:hypothetical protein
MFPSDASYFSHSLKTDGTKEGDAAGGVIWNVQAAIEGLHKGYCPVAMLGFYKVRYIYK